MSEQQVVDPQTQGPAEQDWSEVAAEYQNWHEGLHPYVRRLLAERVQPVPPEVGPEPPINVEELQQKVRDFMVDYYVKDAEGAYTVNPEKADDKPFSQDEFLALYDAKAEEQRYIYAFGGLSKATALRLIEDGEGPLMASGVIRNSFEGLDTEVAHALVEAKVAAGVTFALSQYEGLDHKEFADELITTNQGAALTYKLDEFPELDPKEVLQKLLDSQQYDAILVGLEHFPSVNQQWLADRLIEKDQRAYVINMVEKLPDIDHAKLAEDTLAAGNVDEVNQLIYHVEHFPDINKQRVIDKALELGKDTTTSICYRLDQFPDISQATLEKLMEDYDCVYSIYHNLPSLPGIDQISLVRKGLEGQHGAAQLVAHFDKFDPELLPQIVEMVLTTEHGGGHVLRTIEQLGSLDQQWLARKFVATNNGDEVLRNLDKFPTIDIAVLLQDFVDNIQEREVFNNLRYLSDADKRNFALDLCEMRETKILADYLHDFEGLDIEQAVGEAFLKDRLLKRIPPAWMDKITFSSEELRTWESAYLDLDDISFSRYVSAVARLSPKDRPQITAEAMHLLGEDANLSVTRLIQSVVNGTIDVETRDLMGVHKSGDAGLAELNQTFTQFIAEIRAVELSDETLAKIDQSPALLEILKAVTHYDTATWGIKGSDALKAMLDYRKLADADGRTLPLPVTYTPSDIVEVSKLRSKDKAPWTEDLVARYQTLVGEIGQAYTDLEKPRPFTQLFDELAGEIRDIAGKLELGLQDPHRDPPLTEKGRENIVRRRQELLALVEPADKGKPASYPLRSLAAFEQNFRSLARHDELHPTMRRMVFAWALRQSPDAQLAGDLQALQPEPTIDGVSLVREFVEHVVNQETFKDYFTDKKSANLFKQMTSTKALEEGLLRTQGVGVSADKTRLQFIPTRGVMMELSGHIADACWASRYRSIAESMTNMTAVVIKQNPGDSDREKLVGAGMLIETTDRHGAPILLIRGLNPTENFINHVSVEEFYEQFVGYARGIAEKQGRQLAIVIDNQSGGAASNRPVLFGYLAGKRNSLMPVVVRDEETRFNSYYVSNHAYLV